MDVSRNMLTNINEIDEQHKRIAFLSNKLYKVFEADKPPKEAKEALKNLFDYINYHFYFEEQNFEQFGFIFSARHIQEHKVLLDAISKFQNIVIDCTTEEQYDFLLFIKEWFHKHFIQTDHEYVKVFKENGM